MAKLLMMSIVIAMFAIPIVAARDRRPSIGLRKVVIWTLVFNVWYLFASLFILPHFR
jgi:hypothetical protein